MMEGMLRGRRAARVLERIDRPELLAVSIVLAVLAGVGWLASLFWLAVAVGAELALAGIGAVRLIGPARLGLGFARYATPAMAAVALTLFGRLVAPGTALLLVPLAAVLLWSVFWLELRFAAGIGARTMLDLTLVGIVFLAAAGIWHVFGTSGWPPSLILILLISLVLAVRAAEARGSSGIQAVGEAVLHILAVAQAGAAVVLLGLPGVAGPALVALAFYAWGGAIEALDEGSSLRGVLIEFGIIGMLGLIVALLLHQLA